MSSFGQRDKKSSIPMPTKEDELFLFDESGRRAWFLLVDDLGALELGYAAAYRSAAQVLVDAALNRQRHYLDFPVVFLYRHHAELVLKNIIKRLLHLLDRGLTEDERSHLGEHRLDALWTDLKLQVKEFNELDGFSSLPALEEAAVDSYIAQLTKFDQASFNFRYPASKKGVSTIPKDFEHFNLRHFAELMERLAHHLEKMDDETLDLVDALDEPEGPYGYEAD